MSLNGLDSMVLELIMLSRLWTGGLTVVVEVQSMSMGTHPAQLTRWVAHHQGISRDGFGDHRSSPDEGERSNVVSTDDGGIGTNGGSFSNTGGRVLAPAVDGASGVGDIGEHAGRPEEDILFTNHPSVETDVVLNLAVSTQSHIWTDDNVLANVAVFSQIGAGHDVAEVPDFASLANQGSFVNDGRFMGKVVLHSWLYEVKSLCSVFRRSSSESPRK